MTTALTKLTFVKAPAKQGKDRVADRREKFIDGLEQQKRLLEDSNATVTARKRVTAEDGNVWNVRALDAALDRLAGLDGPEGAVSDSMNNSLLRRLHERG